MKRTTEIARQNLKIDGDLLNAILCGGTVIEKTFNGWDWSILVKFYQPDLDGFHYGQFETCDSDFGFYLMVQRNGTKRDVVKRFINDTSETRRLNKKAFELGNIK